jgi:hypothetical protein
MSAIIIACCLALLHSSFLSGRKEILLARRPTVRNKSSDSKKAKQITGVL